MSDKTESELVVATLTEFFHDSVTDALKNQGVETSEETEFYLVNLLEMFSKAERLHGAEDADEPLALTLRRAVDAPADRSIPLYRRIGDVSLYRSGFFNRSIQREAVSTGYYREMGRGAYDMLSSMMEARRDRVFAGIFAELARKFGHFVEVLIEVSEQNKFGASEKPSDLLDRWMDTRSSNAGQGLVRHGFLPLWSFATEGEHS